MATSWIEIVDTAVKIGLGSLITGVFTYMGIRLTKNSEKEKYLLEHKIKLIEDITTEIEEYFTEVELYISRISGIAKYQKNNNLETTGLNEKQLRTIKEHELKVVGVWPKFFSPISKLKLLKAKSCVSALVDVAELEGELRELTAFDRKAVLYEKAVELSERFLISRKTFYEEIAELYSTLST